MKLACLFSGGKDSNYALFQAAKENEIICLITMVSKNLESYMFQTPGINMAKIQAECLEIPIIEYETLGEKELELKDLKAAIKLAIKKYKIDGIITGAIKSTYQASRIEKICTDLDIFCLNPLWQKNELNFLKDLLSNNFEVILVSIASYPFTKEYLGRKLNETLLKDLKNMAEKYSINPAGEGGELETLVLDSPLFKKKIMIEKTKKIMDSENSGNLIINTYKLINKNKNKNNDNEKTEIIIETSKQNK